MAPRTFTVATSLQDPLTAESVVATLQEAGLDAFTRSGGAASSAGFAAATPAFWDVLVATESMATAQPLIQSVIDSIERDAEQNAKAAEEEALSGEPPVS